MKRYKFILIWVICMIFSMVLLYNIDNKYHNIGLDFIMYIVMSIQFLIGIKYILF